VFVGWVGGNGVLSPQLFLLTLRGLSPLLLPYRTSHPFPIPPNHMCLGQEYLPIVEKEDAYTAVEQNTSGSRPKELFLVSGGHRVVGLCCVLCFVHSSDKHQCC
jgi:hypothetical protein